MQEHIFPGSWVFPICGQGVLKVLRGEGVIHDAGENGSFIMARFPFQSDRSSGIIWDAFGVVPSGLCGVLARGGTSDGLAIII